MDTSLSDLQRQRSSLGTIPSYAPNRSRSVAVPQMPAMNWDPIGTAESSQPSVAAPANTGGSGASDGGYNAYGDWLSGQRSFYDQQLAQQQALRNQAAEAAKKSQYDSYNSSLGALKDQATENQRANWVSMMQDKRRMAQTMAAQGLTGGASESTAASMYNNYLNGQNSVQKSLQDNTRQLGQTLQSNLAAIENQRLTGMASDLSGYQSNVQNAYQSYLSKLGSLSTSGNSGNQSNGLASKAWKAYQSAYEKAIGSGYSKEEAAEFATDAYNAYGKMAYLEQYN